MNAAEQISSGCTSLDEAWEREDMLQELDSTLQELLDRHAAAGDPVRQVCLSLGSNIEPRQNLRRAVGLLHRCLAVEAVSSAWENPPVGSDGPNFLNAAVLAHTPLSPAELKDEVLCRIEAQLGRVRTADKNAPRTIDIDILIVDGELCEPRLWRQAFLAVPVAELLPGYTYPGAGETLAQAARRLCESAPLVRRPEVLAGES